MLYFPLSHHRLWYRRCSVFLLLVLFSVFAVAYSIEGAHQTVSDSYPYEWACTLMPLKSSFVPETRSWTYFVPKVSFSPCPCVKCLSVNSGWCFKHCPCVLIYDHENGARYDMFVIYHAALTLVPALIQITI